MNNQLEILKNQILDLAMLIEESADPNIAKIAIEELYNISGKVDDISQDYEERTDKIKGLL